MTENLISSKHISNGVNKYSVTLVVLFGLLIIAPYSYGSVAELNYEVHTLTFNNHSDMPRDWYSINLGGNITDGKYSLMSYAVFYGERHTEEYDNIAFTVPISNQSAIDIYGEYTDTGSKNLSYIYAVGGKLGNVSYLFEMRHIWGIGTSFYIYENYNAIFEKKKIADNGIVAVHFIKSWDYAIINVAINQSEFEFKERMSSEGEIYLKAWCSLYSLNTTMSEGIVNLTKIVSSYSVLSWSQNTISENSAYLLYLLVIPVVILIADWGWSISKKK